VVGLGTVGEWLLRAIDGHAERIADRDSIELSVVALASKRDGFVHREDGIEVRAALELRGSGRALAELDGVSSWPTALDGLLATETDVLVEVTGSRASDGEPGLSHMRAALRRGASVATSNKWPVALAGRELLRLAAENRLGFRAESTVMSGTPVLSTLTEGLGAATPRRLRGVLNATVNFICSRIGEGRGYDEALAGAQAAGLTEADPSADVDGLDSAAKLMILAALVFDTPLAIDEIVVRGVASLAESDFRSALAAGRRVMEVSTLDPGRRRFGVEAVAVGPDDPLFAIEATTNAVRVEVDPLGELSISGPGAGPRLAGQGVWSDLISLARRTGALRSG
jgi:homoserine dehydrogenase